jgi:hypothetical protein
LMSSLAASKLPLAAAVCSGDHSRESNCFTSVRHADTQSGAGKPGPH